MKRQLRPHLMAKFFFSKAIGTEWQEDSRSRDKEENIVFFPLRIILYDYGDEETAGIRNLAWIGDSSQMLISGH